MYSLCTWTSPNIGNKILLSIKKKLCPLLPVNYSVSFHACTGVIEVLVNSGRQIDAVNLAFAFELTEQFFPVPLLKSYLKEARKASTPVKTGNTSSTAQVCSPTLNYI